MNFSVMENPVFFLSQKVDGKMIKKSSCFELFGDFYLVFLSFP